VADEVRKLAEESKASATLIAGLIEQIQQQTRLAVDGVERGARRTDESTATVEQARQAFDAIGDSVDDLNARIEQIAAASREIATGATRMRDDVSEIAAVAEESSATTEQVSASTEQTSSSTQQIAASAQDSRARPRNSSGSSVARARRCAGGAVPRRAAHNVCPVTLKPCARSAGVTTPLAKRRP
jgi:methyl-accepting chemotaxis protein